jgi:CRP-like cAMP-binding protein
VLFVPFVAELNSELRHPSEIVADLHGIVDKRNKEYDTSLPFCVAFADSIARPCKVPANKLPPYLLKGIAMPAVSRVVSTGNKILSALPHEAFDRIQQHLESVHFKKGEVVYVTGDKIRYVYFPADGIFSLLSTTQNGSTFEIAMVGNEGLVGLPVILKNTTIPYEVTVQFPTDAIRIRAEVLEEEFQKGRALQEIVLRYFNVLMAQVSQLSICNRFHTLERALSRWLLSAQDRANSDSLNLTQENISQALGVPRTGVTMAAGSLQRAGLIRYSRGKIAILDRANLEANSCECYRIIRDEIQKFVSELNSRSRPAR